MSYYFYIPSRQVFHVNKSENISNRTTENENLTRLLLKKQSIDERVYAVLREMMRSVSRNEDIKNEDFSHIFEKCLSVQIPNADFPEYEKTAAVNQKLLHLTACSALDDTASGKRKISDFLLDDKNILTDGKIAYLKNILSDKAFKLFAKHLVLHKAHPMTDFNSVCEAVYDGKADYCILPLENSTDGRLGGFYNLISKYELFVCLAADIMSNDGNVRTRFALCKKNASLFQSSKKDPLWYTELLIRPNGENTMADILFYADFFGVQTVKTDCTPSDYSDKEYNMYVTFISNERKLVKLLMFFAIEQIGYSTIGIYTVI